MEKKISSKFKAIELRYFYALHFFHHSHSCHYCFVIVRSYFVRLPVRLQFRPPQLPFNSRLFFSVHCQLQQFDIHECQLVASKVKKRKNTNYRRVTDVCTKIRACAQVVAPQKQQHCFASKSLKLQVAHYQLIVYSYVHVWYKWSSVRTMSCVYMRIMAFPFTSHCNYIAKLHPLLASCQLLQRCTTQVFNYIHTYVFVHILLSLQLHVSATVHNTYYLSCQQQWLCVTKAAYNTLHQCQAKTNACTQKYLCLCAVVHSFRGHSFAYV